MDHFITKNIKSIYTKKILQNLKIFLDEMIELYY